MPGIKLDVGGGRNPEPGFKVLDIVSAPHVDYVCPSWDTPLEDRSVASLRARHFLEHLTLAEAVATLKEWHRIMLPDGAIDVTVPDILYHAKQLTMEGQSDFVPHSNFDHAMASFYGWQKKGEAMAHKWGYTPKTLVKLFLDSKFDVVLMPCRACDIVVHARKPR
jgi:predicted SAM-dependent methyltransferase